MLGGNFFYSNNPYGFVAFASSGILLGPMITLDDLSRQDRSLARVQSCLPFSTRGSLTAAC